ncbi:MAG: oligosaccharide repeat unit polymerase [Prevotella sp.]|jgi:oligosaccharide repeat unit polymerase|nr:oligosaccharide repeat unit polymerase [Prevotella sp.]MCI1281169.1 oligosaccharide repeat unit polymerase [Prevotella sp.]
MSQVITDNILASTYLIVWGLTFIWYQRKYHSIDAGSFVIIMYIVYAIFSIFSINDTTLSELSDYKPLKLFPYIYLYVMMMIALSPSIYNHNNPTKTIEDPHTHILIILSVIIIICSILLIPDVIKNQSSGLLKLFTDTDAGKDAYMEQQEKASEAGSAIRNLPAIIFNSLCDISIFLFYYFISLKKKKYKIIIGLTFSICIGVLMPIMNGQRSGVITSMLTIIGGYMLFKQYYSKRINRIVRNIGIIAIFVMALPVAAITMSRFSNFNAQVSSFLCWYAGQSSIYFNNEALNPGGTRHGDRTMNLFKRLVDPKTPKNYVERRDKYSNLSIDDNVFTTFVGDFTIDYGPISAFFIFVVFNILVLLSFYKCRSRDETSKLHQLLLLYFTVCISVQGGMYLFTYSDVGGNLRLITYTLLYSYLRYHEALLHKFPLMKQAEIISNK